jgi:hypothetical protein
VAKGIERGSWTSIPRPPSAGGGGKYDKNMPVSATNNLNNTYGVEYATVGNEVFRSFLNLGQVDTSAKTQQINKYVDLETGEEHDMNRLAVFNTSGYSADKDMIIVRLNKEIKRADGMRVRENTELGLKGAQYDDFLKRRFGIDRESLMTKYRVNVPEYLKKPESRGFEWVTPKTPKK